MNNKTVSAEKVFLE